MLVKAWMGIVSRLAETTTGLHKKAAALVLGQLTEKIGDAKFRAGAD